MTPVIPDDFVAETQNRFLQLESGMQELKAQSGKYEQWFNQLHQTDQQLAAQVELQGHKIEQVSKDLDSKTSSLKDGLDRVETEMSRGFSQMEALLEKKNKTSWLGRSGLLLRGPGSWFNGVWLLCLWVLALPAHAFQFTPISTMDTTCQDSLSHGDFSNFAQTGDAFARFYQHSAVHWTCDFGSGLASSEGSVPTKQFEPMGYKSPLSSSTSHSEVLVVPECLCDFNPSRTLAHSAFFPFGEALNPGPRLAIHVANPTGLANKEEIIYKLAPGIANICETHLASPGMTTTCNKFRSWANKDQRRLSILPGAAVPLRARSLTTGTWAGVMQLSDLPCHKLDIPWPGNEFGLGRAQASCFKMGALQIIGFNIYGWAQGPTWPRAHQATRDLLRHITRELIWGSSGMRFVAGDYNGSDETFPEWSEWQQAGWREIQVLHHLKTGDGPHCTCKNSSRPDRLWISPELAAYFVASEVQDLFSDHSVLTGIFDIPTEATHYTWWPMPAKVPWQCIDLASWHATAPQFQAFDAGSGSSSDYFAAIGKHYEDHLSPHCRSEAFTGLPTACRGRGQHFEPEVRWQQLGCPKPSRSGEEQPRSSFMNRAVQKWFSQLRRLQLMRNLRRAGANPSAVAYRLELWASIKRAKGFSSDFASWWPTRAHRLQGSPADLPELLPSLATAEAIYEDFRINYRSFETWNLRHRQATLTAVMRENSKHAFASVKPSKVSAPDRFVEIKTANILDVDPQSRMVHLDAPLPHRSSVTWQLDDEPVQVTWHAEHLLEIHSQVPLMPEQEITQTHHIVELDDMLQHLKDFWSARWQQMANRPTESWDRLLRFVDAYMPRLQLKAPEITDTMMLNIHQRYKAQAARGSDGFDHLDLIQMPMTYHTAFASLFNAIENDGCQWPQQLLLGFCHPLPKKPTAQTVGDHRPIVIFSTLYRSWSAMRSRGLLQQLQHFLSPGVVGFVPHREAGEIWHYIQSLVELALQSDERLLGVVSDVKKAFESIPRQPLFQVAHRLGLPPHVLHAWQSFLDSMQRRFLLHHHLSEPIDSDWGMPEGCGMSVVAMTLIDWCWDHYQREFAPRCLPISYVDNYELLAQDLGELLTGLASMQSFMDLWSLELDSHKTFFWSTSTTDRNKLRSLGKDVRLEAPDLGGAMTYCKRSGAGSQLARLESLQPMWPRLKRSAAPLVTKLYLLRQAFWSKAFHAIGISLMPFRHIAALRTQAVKALGFGHAGAHPGIRLGLLTDSLQSDPGFYQVHRAIFDFRRFAKKCPDVSMLWTHFMHAFDGKKLSGPFSKLMELFDQLNWTMEEPPWVRDHDRCYVDLLHCSTTALDAILSDAWHQRLAAEVATRKDFAGLHGLMWPPSRHESRLNSLQVSRINALREGTFLSGSSQGRFDLVKGSDCSLCGAFDSITHRCCECPAMEHIRDRHSDALRLWPDRPVALTEHLLPSRVPLTAARKRALAQLEDRSTFLMTVPDVESEWLDFFTDGSCWFPAHPEVSLAAWAVTTANPQMTCMAGPLAGIQQDVHRAELTAALVVLRWLVHSSRCAALWTDSSYTAMGLAQILADASSFAPSSNEDLWEEAQQLLMVIPSGSFVVQHVNSHLSEADADDPVDAWTRHGNAYADAAAETAHTLRPVTCAVTCSEHRAAWLQQEWEVDMLRSLHLDIAEHWQEVQPLMAAEEDGAGDQPLCEQRMWVQADDWLDAIPLGWQGTWSTDPRCDAIGTEIALQVVQIFTAERDRAEGSVWISWLELVFMLHILDFEHPSLISRWGSTVWRPYREIAPAQHGQVTCASRIRFAKLFFKIFQDVFGLEVEAVRGLDLSCFRVHPPQQGLCLYVSRSTQQKIDEAILQWTQCRAVKTSNDLTRPL